MKAVCHTYDKLQTHNTPRKHLLTNLPPIISSRLLSITSPSLVLSTTTDDGGRGGGGGGGDGNDGGPTAMVSAAK